MNINELEKMAKLKLNDFEKERFKEFFAIFDFEKLNRVNTDNTEVLVSVTPAQNVMRKDEVIKTIPRGELLKCAPEEEGGYFKVPKTL